MTEPPPSGSDSISPTAHYTGAVWSRNGLSTPELATGLGPRVVQLAAAGDGRLEARWAASRSSSSCWPATA